MRQLFTLFALLWCSTAAFSQSSPKIWQPVQKEAIALPANSVKDFDPDKFSAFRLDYDQLKNRLMSAPMEFTREQKTVTIELPLADGSVEIFSVRQSPVMMPGLQAKFPEIRTFCGESVSNPGKLMRCIISPDWGFHAVVAREDYGQEWIEPIAKNQNEWYRAYDVKDFPDELRLKKPIEPSPELVRQTTDSQRFAPKFEIEERGTLLAPVKLKVYRFALSTTGEFSQDHGGTVPAVMAKLVQYTNDMNIMYERDLDIRLKLVDNNDKVVYLDPDTDPFTGTLVGGWAGQNVPVLNGQIGVANYDIGHNFCRYLGGDASGVAGGLCCTDGGKGAGSSSGTPPYGPGFLAIPGQELGHQWAGGHTWNYCTANNQWHSASACEPGSGSTIMAYPGACGQYNITGDADFYYQACSIAEIREFVENGVGATCGLEEDTGNNPPVVTLNYPQNFFIPISTPFELNGSAIDPDGDTNLSYCWDEVDLGPYSPPGLPMGNAPLFRSYPPSNKTNRYFPNLISIITNQPPSFKEVLPDYSRDLTFRLVVRDNRTGGGGVGTAEVAFKSTELAGPFKVKYPNAITDTVRVGDFITVTWDVANTDKTPVNCQSVNIRLSFDAGQTYPEVLATNVPNIGLACVQIPDHPSNTARIRVDAADNIFFDISNGNFKILPGNTPTFGLCTEPLAKRICNPATFTAEIASSSVAGFSDPISLEILDAPTNAIASLSAASISPGQNSTLTVEFPVEVPEGTFTMKLRGKSGSVEITRDITFTVLNSDFTAFALTSPADGATGNLQSPDLQWVAVEDADQYEVQVSTSPSFAQGTIVASSSTLTLGHYKVPVVLEKGKTYYWRVRPKNECGIANWSETYSFSTLVENCSVFQSLDLPANISSNGTPSAQSKINILGGGTVSDVNIKQLKGNHQSFKQLELHLISPAGTDVLLFRNKCGSIEAAFNFALDDAAPNFPCPPSNTLVAAKPTGSLAALAGQNSAGEWKLTIKDNEVGSGGTIEAFQLEICSATSLNPPIIVENNPLMVGPGSNEVIPNALLKAEDVNNTADQLTFTLVSVPRHGHLSINFGAAAQPGDQFKQTDLDNGNIRYYDWGGNAGSDDFRFVVTDGEGGMASGKFLIQQGTLGAGSPLNDLSFSLSPNPADETVNLVLGENFNGKTQVKLTNAAGQLLKTQNFSPGNKNLILQIADLPQGVYLVSVENEKGRGVKKLVVK